MRVGDDGVIEKVTSSESSRLGNPTTGFVQEETVTYTKSNGLLEVAQTMRRGTSGMGGRGLELANAWDPAEVSTASQTFTSRHPTCSVLPAAAANLSYKNKRDRRKIHAFVYVGASHVDLDSIEAEAFELLSRTLRRPNGFYGNRLVRGMGIVDARRAVGGRVCQARGPGCLTRPTAPRSAFGFDGSINNDTTGIRAQTMTGFAFTPRWGPDRETPTFLTRKSTATASRTPRSMSPSTSCSTGSSSCACTPTRGLETPTSRRGSPATEKSTSSSADELDQPHVRGIRRFEADLANGRITQDGCAPSRSCTWATQEGREARQSTSSGSRTRRRRSTSPCARSSRTPRCVTRSRLAGSPRNRERRCASGAADRRAAVTELDEALRLNRRSTGRSRCSRRTTCTFEGEQPLKFLAPVLQQELGYRLSPIVLNLALFAVDVYDNRLDVEGFRIGRAAPRLTMTCGTCGRERRARPVAAGPP